MPFFHQTPQSLAREQEEMDLFQLLSLLDASSQHPNPCAPRHHIRKQQAPAPTFIPAFDILETASGYELFGEVPGLDVKTLDIQFSDAQTLVLKGVTGRAAPTASVAEQKVVVAPVEEEKKGKQATVSDGEEEYDEVDTPLTTSSTTITTPAPEKKVEEPKKIQARYWLTERKIGSFARSFSFAQRIEMDDVKAELKEGVLHVIVPKSLKSKKVEVSVF